ncbi:MAG: hypothetical protein LBG90_00140 [Spirochaetaceae bacterium]|jgi:hypothetical protein|nr:hypothetical protein [Spirochaetaceae bacterium]
MIFFRKKRFFLIILLIWGTSLFGQSRSFDALFPRLPKAEREQAFSPQGVYILHEKSGALRLIPVMHSGIDIAGPVLNRNLPYLVEALFVVQPPRPVGLNKVYNALGNIQGLKGRLYHSFSKNADVPLFEEATRLISDKKLTPIPDPPPTGVVPTTETAYIRLKDASFGNIYYRAVSTAGDRHLIFYLSNFKSVSFLFIPVLKENNFVSQLYFELIREGVLVYSIAGANISDFAASQIDISSAIQKRLEVIVQWVAEGIVK